MEMKCSSLFWYEINEIFTIVIFRNATALNIKQELTFVGSEEGKRCEMRELFDRVCNELCTILLNDLCIN